MPRPFVFLALLLSGAGAPSWAADPQRYMSAELISQTLSPAPGSTILVGIRMKPRPGWHGYWSNPGDAGIETSVDWSAPGGIGFGPLLHPAPVLLTAEGISSFAHEGEHVLLSRMTVPRGLAAGTPLPVRARLSWAACTATMCVPLQATLALEMTAGRGERSAESGAIRAALAKLPAPAAGGTFASDGRSIRLVLPAAVRLDPGRTRFFPDDNDAFRTARGRARSLDGRIVITGPADGDPPRRISGVATDGRAAYRLTLLRDEAASAAAKTEPVAEAESSTAPATRPAPSKNAAGKAPTPTAKSAPLSAGWLWLALAAIAIGAALIWRRLRPR